MFSILANPRTKNRSRTSNCCQRGSQLTLLALVTCLCLAGSAYAQQAKVGRNQKIALPKGKRILSISITEPEDNDFDGAISLAKAAGLQATSLSLAWDDLEIAPGVFQPPIDWLAIANAYYPTQKIALCLEINPIDTVALRLPPDLIGRAFDDPLVVTRYKALLDYVFASIPKLSLVSFSIGNEVDVYFGNDALAWQAYANFFTQVADYARSFRPRLAVGAKLTYSGLMGSNSTLAAPLVDAGDGVFVTYYPLNPDFTVQSPTVVMPQIGKLVAAYPTRLIYFLEIGYPSGAGCGSSDAKQAQFIRRSFKAWDAHAEAIRLMEFTWMHDISQTAVDTYELYYGISNPAFLSYLGTLGLRTYTGSGSAKPAWNALTTETAKRAW